MRSLFGAIFGLITLSAFADGMRCAPSNCPSNLRNQICLYETFDHQGVNVGFRGDLLYMVYQAPILTYASEQTTSSEILHSNILNVPGKLSLGCNIALLYTMPYQPGYSFESGWYHIVARFSRNVTADNIVPAHSVTLSLPAPAEASVNAHMTFNFFDFLMKKDFGIGEWVCMTPAVGLVGGYMNGKNTAHFDATSGAFSAATSGNTESTVATLAYQTKFEGIGLKLGGQSSFRICGGFKLQAELFYSVLYGLAKAHLDYSQNGLSLEGTVRGSLADFHQHHGRAFFDSLLGFSWEKTFCDSLYMNLHAGWRFQTFSEGWKEFEAELNDSLHELALSGQGLQAGATFKF